MITFNEFLEHRQIESLVETIGGYLYHHKIHPLDFAEAEMPEPVLSELWGMFGGKKKPVDTTIDFKGAMASVLKVVQQIQQKGLGNRAMNFTSGPLAGQTIPLVSWLNDMVSKLGKLNSKFYSNPDQTYSQQAAAEPDRSPNGANSWATRNTVGNALGLKRNGFPSNAGQRVA